MSNTAIALRDAGVRVLDCEHKTPSAQKSGHPYIAIPDIQDGRVILDQVRLISDDDLLEWTRRTVPMKGDILVTRRGRVGDTAPLPDIPCAIGQNLVLLRSDGTKVDGAFLRWAVRSPEWWGEVERLLNVGAVFSSLNVKDIGQIRLSLPPIPEQRAIAEVLGALDDKITANTALAATARELGVAMLRIEAPTTALGNVVLHHKRQINPANMEEDLVEHYSLPAFDGGGGPEVVMPNSIKSNKFAVDTSAVLVSKLNPQTPRAWPINAGDAPPRLASTEFLVLEPLATDPWVMWCLLSQPSFSAALQGLVAGTSGSHQRVRVEEVLATPILDPRSIQPQLLADVGEILAPIDALMRENRTLAATRDALLPQLMSGTLRVRDAGWRDSKRTPERVN